MNGVIECQQEGNQMDEAEILDQLSILLDAETTEQRQRMSNYQYQRVQKMVRPDFTGAGPQEVLHVDNLPFPTILTIVSTDNIRLKYDNLETITKIFNSLKDLPDSQIKCVVFLLEKISTMPSAIRLIVHFLIKSGNLDLLLDTVYGETKRRLDYAPIQYIVPTLTEMIYYEYTLFNYRQFKKIKDIYSLIIEHDKYLKSGKAGLMGPLLIKFDPGRIKQIIFLMDLINLLLIKHIRSIYQLYPAFEIVQDKERLKQRILDFSFEPILNETLDKIDDYYWNTPSDKFVYRHGLSLLRQFLETLIDSISTKIFNKTNEPIPTEKETKRKSKIGNQRLYIMKHLQLSKDVDKILDSVVDICNDEGAHAFITDKEFLRLTKNIVIEISLMILTKLNDFLSK